ncbi:methyltransferase domain-containing protein [Auraticoccus sp. F435]|uniref:Methyltransferase domain-containing protein n=1 Tax=Auraticoccus cholistanensis TaxID=2656650 RepID=A0A6A9V0D9_9ACTN|nr:methyltransferase domain-containing protein [Auraticoccus cholistanensis]
MDTEVTDAFTETAEHYDALVALNPGYHEHLRSSARALLDELAGEEGPLRLLDLGCGSGASTDALVTAVHEHGRGDECQVEGVDASEGMLAQARAKSWPGWVRFRSGRAEQLGADGGGWDGVLAAYLVRNVPARDELVADLYRALRPGGVLVLHEYAVRGDRRATAVWTLVCWLVVIPLAAVVTRRSGLHRYLWRSVLDFDSVDELQQRLHRAGFIQVRRRTFGNWQRDILHTVVAVKPRP